LADEALPMAMASISLNATPLASRQRRMASFGKPAKYLILFD
jgi:hypothetical protein